MTRVEIKIDLIREMTVNIFRNAGIATADAELIADSFIDAEITGLDSHGLMRLESYIERINKNLINKNPKVRVTNEIASILKIDGDNGLGQIVTKKAFELCIQRAEETGLAVAAIRNTNHFGAAGYFTRIACDSGYISFATTNASPTMPPYGGVEPIFGTNPFCVSFPAGKYKNFTHDIAMTAVARGKIRMYEQQDRSIPLGWAMNSKGYDTTDPKEALCGGLLPMGGHKGYGLAIVIDMLCGIISGAKLSLENETMFSSNTVNTIGNFIGVMKIEAIMKRTEFEQKVEEWFDIIKNSRTRPGFDKIYIPGEQSMIKRRKTGQTVSVLEKTYERIIEMHSVVL